MERPSSRKRFVDHARRSLGPRSKETQGKPKGRRLSTSAYKRRLIMARVTSGTSIERDEAWGIHQKSVSGPYGSATGTLLQENTHQVSEFRSRPFVLIRTPIVVHPVSIGKTDTFFRSGPSGGARSTRTLIKKEVIKFREPSLLRI